MRLASSGPLKVAASPLTHNAPLLLLPIHAQILLLTLNTPRQKAVLFLQTVVSSKKQQGEIRNHLFFE